MAQRRRSPLSWLVLAAVLLGLGAWLMRGAEPPERPPPPEVRLPTAPTRAERERRVARQTLTPMLEVDAGVFLAQPARDPVLALAPSEVKSHAVVAEWNAIVNSDLGGLLVDCLSGGGEGLGWLRDAGLDPVQGVDRIAMFDDTLVVTGDFKATDWKRFLGEDARSKGYGRQGELHEIPLRDGGADWLATWGQQLVLVGATEEELKRSLDRLDGTGPKAPGVLEDSMAYGEVYGVLMADKLADVFGREDPKLAQLVRDAASTVQVHLDVTHDVGLVGDVQGAEPQKTEELRRALGSALSLARMRAEAKGQDKEAQLLDLAHVRSADGQSAFRLEAGLPYEFMVDALKGCTERRKRDRADGEARRSPDAGS